VTGKSSTREKKADEKIEGTLALPHWQRNKKKQQQRDQVHSLKVEREQGERSRQREETTTNTQQQHNNNIQNITTLLPIKFGNQIIEFRSTSITSKSSRVESIEKKNPEGQQSASK
jgi:hypothetical protein